MASATLRSVRFLRFFELLHTFSQTLTSTFNCRRTIVVTHTGVKYEGRRSRGSKDRVERTDRRTCPVALLTR